MGKIKSWMMDMDSRVEEAYFQGCTPEEIVKYVKQRVYPVDEPYIREKIKEYYNG